MLIFRERGRARSWHGSLYRQRLGSGVPVIEMWGLTGRITSLARLISPSRAKVVLIFAEAAPEVRFGSRRTNAFGPGLNEHKSHHPTWPA